MSARIKHHGRHILYAAFAALLFLCLPGGADAATFGNDVGASPTHLTEPITNSGAQNSLAAGLQTFSLTASMVPATLELWLSKSGTPADDLIIDLCAYADTTDDDPCRAGGAGLLQTWTITADTLPAFDVNPPGAAPISLDVDEGIILYSSVPYTIVVERAFGDTSNYPRWSYNTGWSGSGEKKKWIYGSCVPNWQEHASTSPSNCGDTSGNHDWLFRFTELDSGTLSLTLSQNGPQVWAAGACVRPSDLPAGWTLYSNLVDLEYRDTSATGTLMLSQAECTNGGYTNFPGLTLWNGTWEVTARQPGTPNSWEVVQQITIEGSDVQNPTAILDSCEQFDLVDVLTDFDDAKEAASCQTMAFLTFLTDIAPFKWRRQLAAYTASGTTSWEIGLPLPDMEWQAPRSSVAFGDASVVDWDSEQGVSVYDSATATGVADEAAQEFPWFRTYAVYAIWGGVVLYLVGLVWVLLRLL